MPSVQALTGNKVILSLGRLDNLPIPVALRSSLEWYTRANRENVEQISEEHLSLAKHREGRTCKLQRASLVEVPSLHP